MIERYNENPFTLSFGNVPFEQIKRNEEKEYLIKKIKSTPPMSHCFIIAGVRGSGKTVTLASTSKSFKDDKDWVVIELNSEDDMREALAAKLYGAAKVKHLFLEKNFNFSFHGISFSIKGKNPILNVENLLELMLREIKKQNKKSFSCYR